MVTYLLLKGKHSALRSAPKLGAVHFIFCQLIDIIGQFLESIPFGACAGLHLGVETFPVFSQFGQLRNFMQIHMFFSFSFPFKGRFAGFRKACFAPQISKPLASGAVGWLGWGWGVL
ncbi:hypothetical protein [Undibacterium sp. TC9W]|uniref:hypothetical protein n=1 Tax=Undibacterium sp. TC9W TaxID=3413053 RepID=UPI003BF1029D